MIGSRNKIALRDAAKLIVITILVRFPKLK